MKIIIEKYLRGKTTFDEMSEALQRRFPGVVVPLTRTKDIAPYVVEVVRKERKKLALMADSSLSRTNQSLIAYQSPFFRFQVGALLDQLEKLSEYQLQDRIENSDPFLEIEKFEIAKQRISLDQDLTDNEKAVVLNVLELGSKSRVLELLKALSLSVYERREWLEEAINDLSGDRLLTIAQYQHEQIFAQLLDRVKQDRSLNDKQRALLSKVIREGNSEKREMISKAAKISTLHGKWIQEQIDESNGIVFTVEESRSMISSEGMLSKSLCFQMVLENL